MTVKLTRYYQNSKEVDHEYLPNTSHFDCDVRPGDSYTIIRTSAFATVPPKNGTLTIEAYA